MRSLCAVVFTLIAATAFAQNDCGTTPDFTRPVFGPITDVVAATTAGDSACGTALVIAPPAVYDACPVTITVQGMPVGNIFPVGSTTLIWSARDLAGNLTQAIQRVNVIDATPPILAGVSNVTRLATSLPLANALPIPIAADNCGTVTVTGSNPGPYPAGDTVVVWAAVDAAGNAATAAQQLTVVPAGTIAVTSATYTKHGNTEIYTPQPIELRIYNAADVPNQGKKGIEAAWNNATPIAPPNIELTGPTLVSAGNGSVYVYTAILPAGTSYVPIGRSIFSPELLHDRAVSISLGSVHQSSFVVRVN